MATLHNWNKSDRSQPLEVVTPESAERLKEVIKDFDGFPSPLRAAGERHSTTPCFAADGGTQVLMHGFNEVSVSAAANRVTVGAGVTMLRIRDELRRNGLRLQLAVAPEIGNATAGAIACAGTKDSTLNPQQARDLAQIGSLVREVEMVDAHGDRIRVNEAGALNLETGQPVPNLDLKLVRSSYGLLGIIYQVTLETSPLVPLRNRFETVPLWKNGADSPRLVSIDDIFEGADAVLGFLGPYQGPEARRGKILVERRRILPRGDEPTEQDQIKRAARDWVWEWGGHLLPTLVTGLADALRKRGHSAAAVKAVVEGVLGDLVSALVDNPFGHLMSAVAANPLGGVFDVRKQVRDTLEHAFGMIHAEASIDELLAGIPTAIAMTGVQADEKRPRWVLDLLDKLPGVVLGALGDYRAYRSDSLIDFSPDRATFFDFTFWAFPQSAWGDVVPRYLAFCDEHERETGFRPTLFTEVYFICQDSKSLLSFSPQGPVFTLDIVDNRPGDRDWHAMCRAYNRWAVTNGGRPLFNQTKHLETTPGVRSLVQRAFGEELWARFSNAVWAANPPLPGSPDGRFVNRFFTTLLEPRPLPPAT